MNYNNKPKPALANLLENMMMSTQKNDGVQMSRSSRLALWRPLHRVLFVLSLATAAPVMVYASEGNILTNGTAQNAGNIPASNTPPQPTSAVASDLPTQLDRLSSEVANLKKQEQDRQQKEAQTTPLWKKLLFTILAVFGLAIFYLLLRISTSKQLQEKLDQITEQNRENAREIAHLANRKQEQVKNALSKLQKQLEQLEQSIQQQTIAAPIVVKISDPRPDIPTLQSEFTPSKPLISIDADDRKVLQQAFLEWRLNSRSKKLHDFLPSSFLEKIKQLGYEVVFAKAGVGLERMIIDRKPPSNTRMVGLSSTAHSLMYCYDKTYQGDECWTPNTWYEVTIGSPDADDEQTVHQLEKLQELPT